MFPSTKHAAALLTLSLVACASSAAAGPVSRELAGVPISSAPTQGLDKLQPWPAPVGHRQPRIDDIPAVVPRNAADAEQERLDRMLSRKLMICRGC